MELLNRRDFDRLVIAGEVSAIQAIQVKEGICMVARKNASTAYMLQRSDLKPYLWKHVTGPLAYAKSRGCDEIAFLFRDDLSVNDVLSGSRNRV